MKILLGVTGSVAATLTQKLTMALTLRGHEVRIIGTGSSFYFWDESKVAVPVYRDKDEWPGQRYKKGDSVLHIELRDWADLLLIAPLTANTLAKIACGICDNLLTSVVRAWNVTKPILLAPAMNTQMWNKCVTEKHLALVSLIYRAKIIEPQEKILACGEEGMGAMAEIGVIARTVNFLDDGDGRFSNLSLN